MKKLNVNFWICFAVMCCAQVQAREYVGAIKKSANATNKIQIKDCDPGITQIDLDINNVRAKILNTGDMWWDRSSAKYQVPKISKAALAAGEKGPNTLFSGSIWISGKDDGGNLKIAALTFSGREAEFWPGPLSKTAGLPSIDKSECKLWDQFFNVYSTEIDLVRGIFKKSGAVSTAEMPNNIKYWPAKGNVYLQDKGLIPPTEYLAPFYNVDKDPENNYNPEKGDYPCINPENESYADQMIFWVINDVGNVHTSSQGQAIGVQLNCLAFAFASTNDLNNMTFYRYQIVNKSSFDLKETYMSQFVDCDMGNYNDDYVGCDTTRALGFVYNSDPFDENVGSLPGYGDQPPIQGVDFFEGPVADKDGIDNDRDGLIDEGFDGIDNDKDGLVDERDEMEQLGLTSFVYFVNATGKENSDPTIGIEFRNYQTGYGRTGKRFRVGGDGLGSTGDPTNFLFPGDPSLAKPAWSMCSENLTAQDIRFVQSSGAFTLKAGSEQFITIGAVFVQPPVGSYNGCKINVSSFLGKADDLAQNLFDNQFKVARGPQAPDLNIREGDQELLINIVNPPSSNNANEAYKEKSPDIPKGATDDSYQFEGYLLYQLISSDVSVSDLSDPTKAKLILQSDIKNGIKDVANEEIVEINGNKVPIQVVKVKGTDKGLVKSLKLTTDYFQNEGQPTLVNNKEYYYGVVAYATNFYEIVRYDTLIINDVDTKGNPITYKKVEKRVDSQKFPFKAGQNMAKFSAIPHKVNVNGVTYRCKYNDGIPVTRILGQGNGTNELEFLDTTYSNFFPSTGGFKTLVDELTYKGGNSPVTVKVIDPKLVQDVDFEIQIIDTYRVPNPISTTARYIVIDKTNSDTVLSERDLSRPNDQILISKTGRKYGISLNTSFVSPRTKNPATGESAYTYINATMSYSNIAKKWLNLIKDQNGTKYKDWIKSGITQNTISSNSSEFNSHFYLKPNDYTVTFYDPDNHYANMLNGAIAPYCLAANGLYYSNTNIDASYITYGPAFRWRNPKNTSPEISLDNTGSKKSNSAPAPEYNLEKLQSVDIILTNDRTKWSRCVVMETGEIAEQNEGKTLKGQIRSGFSVAMIDIDKDFDGVKDGFEQVTNDTGRGYFPGYAINVETGERLNIFFGENSSRIGTYAGNMVWDPNSTETAKFGEPIFGGMHFIYVSNTRYDEGVEMQRTLLNNYNKFVSGGDVPQAMRDFYKKILYTAVPLAATGYDMYTRSSASTEDKSITGYGIPSDVRIRIRVERPLATFQDNAAYSKFDSTTLVYNFSTKGLSPIISKDSITSSVLDQINIVPNPYYAYSIYETDQISNVVKLTNLPGKCDITIFDVNGVIVRRFSKDIDDAKIDVSDGANLEAGDNLGNLDNSIKWDLKNHKGVPIASGIYYIHISAPGIGERTLKFFGVLRPTDVTSF